MLAGKRVILTGATGFLGQHILKQFRLNPDGPKEVFAVLHKEFDLTIESEVQRMYENAAAGSDTVVIHCAAECGGIGLNQARPGRLFYANLMMNTLLMEHAVWNKVGKYVAVGSICSYPAYPIHIPFQEKDIWDGYPEATNAAYGMAKKMQLVQAEAYRKQYGLKVINLMLANLYGPGDNYNPETSHVIPAIINKIVGSKAMELDNVLLWGTGEPTRDFLYVEDAAKVILMAAEEYEEPKPMNIGTGVETPIYKLARLLVRELNYEGKLVWDPSRPDGQARRVLDTRRMQQMTSWNCLPLELGLKETVKDYLARRPGTL